MYGRSLCGNREISGSAIGLPGRIPFTRSNKIKNLSGGLREQKLIRIPNEQQ